jgi:4-hydroxythreonine-4-phosphate dehydrogenase
MGDAAGIGPELTVRAAAEERWREKIRFVLYGEHSILQEAANRWTEGVLPEVVDIGSLRFADLNIGQADPRCGKSAYEALSQAVRDTLAGKADAIVTAPMNKYSVNLAGIPFTGHTERLAELCNTPDYVMMQSAGSLRMVFVTCHVPLAEVPQRADEAEIIRVTRLLYQAIRSEGIRVPKIAVAAINPHAGENGCMGSEDEEVVKPAVAELKAAGLDVEGPFPPDTLFVPSLLNQFDGVVSMYHDQGHIPFKMVAFDTGVNSTLGLPIIRTSPDHGTAFQIAGKNIADTGSFFAAVEVACVRAVYRKAARR